MKLIEADGKQILKAAGVAVPRSVFFDPSRAAPSVEDVSFPCFVKAQVLQGRRGRQGLVVRCEAQEDVPHVLEHLRQHLADVPCAGFLCEEAVPHDREMLVSLAIDRRSGGIRCSISDEGGMDVSVAQTQVIHHADEIEAMERLFPSVRQVLRQMHAAMMQNDALEIEINPLAIRSDGSCVALDAKIELDDAAAFRHPEWSAFAALSPFGRTPTEREQAYATFVQTAGHRGTFGKYLELDGNIGMILSGGGASLVALDALRRVGGRPANYCEMSGNPDPDAACQAAKLVLSHPGIRAVWIAGSYANFTDIDATVRAVLRAIEEIGLRVPVCIRRDGPRADEAVRAAEEWSTRTGVSVHFDRADASLEDSARTLMTMISPVNV